ncbi:hypothetical protein [Streptomyces resistomycificus]|uniref:hypothetical protein n=1 Tax=Streptomyces resistomycificus TaxID=67356 RepID=UPI0012FF59BF|nr:hypothetical protein [Streptomyces resistomycificus]
MGDLVSDPSAGRIGAVVAVATAVVDGSPKAVTLHDDSSVRAWCLAEQQYEGLVAPLTHGNQQRVSLTAAVVGGRLVAITGGWEGQVQRWDVAALHASDEVCATDRPHRSGVGPRHGRRRQPSPPRHRR